MPEPKVASFPAIRGALKFYQVASIVTGIMLLLLLAEMVLKYSPMHIELFAGGEGGLLWFAPVLVGDGCQWYSLFVPGGLGCEMDSTGQTVGGTNISLLILISHGWFYVVYLFACFRVWSLMRWQFPRFIMLALGGVVPMLSFIMEVRVVREVREYLDAREAAETADAAVIAQSEGTA